MVCGAAATNSLTATRVSVPPVGVIPQQPSGGRSRRPASPVGGIPLERKQRKSRLAAAHLSMPPFGGTKEKAALRRPTSRCHLSAAPKKKPPCGGFFSMQLVISPRRGC
jgi:hypothetical protein